MEPCITFVIGGARSGKSAFAENLARGSGEVIYIATARAGDPEMSSRIAAHRSRRPDEWSTWEGDVLSLPDELEKISAAYNTMLFDSLSMYLSAAMFALPENAGEDETLWSSAEKKILEGVRGIFAAFSASANGRDKRLIVVSDEVGCGIVPHYPIGRRFRDLLGLANQIAAHVSDEAALVVAGIPLWIKTRAPEK